MPLRGCTVQQEAEEKPGQNTLPLPPSEGADKSKMNHEAQQKREGKPIPKAVPRLKIPLSPSPASARELPSGRAAQPDSSARSLSHNSEQPPDEGGSPRQVCILSRAISHAKISSAECIRISSPLALVSQWELIECHCAVYGACATFKVFPTPFYSSLEYASCMFRTIVNALACQTWAKALMPDRPEAYVVHGA